MNSPRLEIFRASRAAAKFAVENWHYSKSLPASRLNAYGVKEDGEFIGVVIFSNGSNLNSGKRFGLAGNCIMELTRVALRNHETEVSKILKFVIREFRKDNPLVEVLVSYADASEAHHGGIYQAMGWTYTGESISTPIVGLNGRKVSQRTSTANDQARLTYSHGVRIKIRKHRYYLVLNGKHSAVLASMAQPYPKRARSREIAVPAFRAGEGSAILTRALQLTTETP